jgi:hypothetical protein
MAKVKKSASVRRGRRGVAEDFKASFGVPASVPSPTAAIGGSDHHRPADQHGGETSAFPFDDKDNPVAKNMQSKAGMMNEILSVLNDLPRTRVAEAHSRIVKEDRDEEDGDEHETRHDESEQHGDHVRVGDDSDDDDDGDTRKESRRVRGRRLGETAKRRRGGKALRESEYDMEEPDISGHHAWAATNAQEAGLDEEDESDLVDDDLYDDEYDHHVAENFDHDEDEDEDEDDLKEDADNKARFHDHSDGDEEEKETPIEEAKRLRHRRSLRKLRREDLKIRYDIRGLFEGNNFTPEFEGRIKDLFETAVLTTVNDNLTRIDRSAQRDVAVLVSKEKRRLTEALDKYLDYVTRTFMTENRLAIETGLRLEQYDSFMSGLRSLFEDHYVSVDPVKQDKIKRLAEENDALQSKLNKQIKANVVMKGQLEEQVRERVLDQVSSGLALTQKDKLRSLAESVEFTTDQAFAARLKALRRSFIQRADREEYTPVSASTMGGSALMESIDEQLARLNTTGGNISAHK